LEEEFLLCCVRTRFDARATERISVLIQHDLDWDGVIGLARLHSVTPIVYWQLKELFPEAVPPATMTQLRNHFRDTAKRNLLMAAEMIRILDFFEQNGIPAIPFKGPSRAQAAYGNIALREFVDIDILVHKEDAVRVKALLPSTGYEPRVCLNATQAAIALLSDCEYGFSNPAHGTAVEVHWGVGGRPFFRSLNDKSLWDHARWIPLFGTTILTPAPEDDLLAEGAHATKHWWGCLCLLCDIAELIRSNPQMDWEQLLCKAKSQGNLRILCVGLSLTHDVLGVDLPATVLETLRSDRVANILAHGIRKRLFDRAEEPRDLAMLLRFIGFKERLRDKLRTLFLYAVLPDQADYNYVPLPVRLVKCYYAIRPLRLIIRYLYRRLNLSSDKN
jgi:Uncharacterised nucleotidyltransferase